MGQTDIVIRGAREHNLKGVDLTIPRESLVTVTGVSGSGKSSLAFDTLFREGQRRFLESLSAYARQFVGRMEKPRVESITGLSPTISIDQKTVNRNPRSTVGTITEAYDYLRLLFARLGLPHCPSCGRELRAQGPDQIVAQLLQEHAPSARCTVLAPVVRDRKGHYRKELEAYRRKGFVRARIDGRLQRLDEPIELDRYKRHTIELVIDRIVLEADRTSRLAEAVENALRLAGGQLAVLVGEDQHREFSTSLSCPACGLSLPEMEPRLFSFNSPHGACGACNGLGRVRRVDPRKVVPDPSLSLAEGAIKVMTATGYLPYVRLNQGSLAQVAKHLGFRVDQPWRELTRKQQDALLYGSRERLRIRFEHASASGSLRVKGMDHRALPGLIPCMEEAWERSHPRHLEKFLSDLSCQECHGKRLRPEALHVTFRGRSIVDFTGLTLDEAGAFFDELVLGPREEQIGSGIVRELRSRLSFLRGVGIGYLTLERSAASLSGGEGQRVRLATQVGAGLQGVLYVLDEPSIGLHSRDHGRLLDTLVKLRDRNNTVLVVEHDRDTMLASDWLVDVGPGAGRLGGEIVAEGPLSRVLRHSTSRTAAYLRGAERVVTPGPRRAGSGKKLRIEGAAHFNLKDVDVDIPLGMLVGVTGVSGSGKSTLVHLILRRELARRLHQAEARPGEHRRLLGVEHLDKVVEIDQAPIGRTPRSNPATYTGVWDPIRDLFASTVEARTRGYKKGRFSFNVKGGRCEACGGAGVRTIEMQFLADVEIPCEDCGGRRFHRETLEIQYRGRNVHEVLEMTAAEALEHFASVPKVARILQTLVDVGLDYVRLGQPSTTLSGGEAQRVKLATELARPATGNTLYILDEPTTGLHFDDIRRLLQTLSRLVDRGNTVLVIEHNLDVVLGCDYLIDLGPEGGAAGGSLVASGTPEEVMRCSASHTGRALKAALAESRPKRSPRRRRPAADASVLSVRGARKNNLQGIDVDLPHDRMIVVTGPSGSGKTSLAFDTLFAEGQRRFVESLSTYARRFFSRLDRAPVDRVSGLRPAIAIDQKASARSPRSTVATTTEIYDYLRLLYARIGAPHCPSCGTLLRVFSPSAVARELLARSAGQRVWVLAPLYRRGTQRTLFLEKAAHLAQARESLQAEGFVRLLVDGEERRLDDPGLEVSSRTRSIDLVIDRLRLEEPRRVRIAEAVEEAQRRGHGLCAVRGEDGAVREFSSRVACDRCNYYLTEELSPRHFSFNHHRGACPDCEGLGHRRRAVAERVVLRPDRPLLSGALVDYPGRYFTRKTSYVGSVLRSAAAELGADLTRPFQDLSARHREGLLRGAGLPGRLAVNLARGRVGRRREYSFFARWRGILGEIEHWLRNGSEGKWWIDRLLALTEEGPCPTCGGGRLRPEALAVKLNGRAIHEVTRLDVGEAHGFFRSLELRDDEREIAKQPLQEIEGRLRFLSGVGLDYLTLDRRSATLSGGEAQRIRLATQLGSGLVGVLYVLDEPSIGLHPRDTRRLIDTLLGLRDLGNTVVVVEHDEEMIRAADHLVDLGPGAGAGGGRVCSTGSVAQVARDKDSPTGAFLSGRRRIATPPERRRPARQLTVRGARRNNLQDLDVSFPLGTLTVVTGVSGSGKSTLVMEVLRPGVVHFLEGRRGEDPGCQGMDGLKELRQLVVIDQSPIGTTPSSNPATYTKVLDPIREVFAATPDARMKGFTRTRFSFNQGEGRCLACQGRGSILVEMHFLSDLWVPCEACRGRRFNEETLAVRYRERNIAEVLDLEVAEALAFFASHRRIQRILQVLEDVGLGYLKLGQSSTTLSGGEAQRVKLAAELARPSAGRTLYLLDEPTTGLHLTDVEKLVGVLHRLVDRGNTVVVIEHQLDVVKNADWVIDLGPEGGEQGGRLVCAGTPEDVARCAGSHTGRWLQRVLPGAPRRAPGRPRARRRGEAKA